MKNSSWIGWKWLANNYDRTTTGTCGTRVHLVHRYTWYTWQYIYHHTKYINTRTYRLVYHSEVIDQVRRRDIL
jgi:hypothetical protein